MPEENSIVVIIIQFFNFFVKEKSIPEVWKGQFGTPSYTFNSPSLCLSVCQLVRNETNVIPKPTKVAYCGRKWTNKESSSSLIKTSLYCWHNFVRQFPWNSIIII